MIDKEISETLKNYEQADGARKRNIGEYISYNSVMWLSSQQKLIDSQSKQLELAVKALKEISTIYMRYIENEIECDTAATRMDNIAEDALSSIQSLGRNETP